MVEQNELPARVSALLSLDGDGPAARIDALAAAGIIERALSSAALPQRRRMRKAGYALIAAFVLTGSAAAMYAAQRGARTAARAPRPAMTAHATPAPAAAPPADTQPAAQPVAPVPARSVTEPRVPARSMTEPRVPARSITEPRVPARSMTEPRVPARAGAADDLLQRANRLRGDGDYRGAERTYLRAVALGPNGPAAYAARVAAAGLRLERFVDARGALQLYAEAQRAQPTGALAPEIHEGMAHAYRALGRVAEERGALQALLSEQPSGPAAERARARLQVLDAGR